MNIKRFAAVWAWGLLGLALILLWFVSSLSTGRAASQALSNCAGSDNLAISCSDGVGNAVTLAVNSSTVQSDELSTGGGIAASGILTMSQVYLPICTHNYCPDGDFFDDFSNPASGWEVGDDAFVRTEYLNGEYRVLTRQSDVYLFKAPACDRQDYIVEVDARWADTPGRVYGLIFGTGKPEWGFKPHYVFEVDTYLRYYFLTQYDELGYATSIAWGFTSAIGYGTASNHLKVTRNGDQITLEVNGTVLGTWLDGTISGSTGAGLMTIPYYLDPVSDARFDNFAVITLPDSGASALGPSGAMAEER
jgi:hypothetical protein